MTWVLSPGGKFSTVTEKKMHWSKSQNEKSRRLDWRGNCFWGKLSHFHGDYAMFSCQNAMHCLLDVRDVSWVTIPFLAFFQRTTYVTFPLCSDCVMSQFIKILPNLLCVEPSPSLALLKSSHHFWFPISFQATQFLRVVARLTSCSSQKLDVPRASLFSLSLREKKVGFLW